MADPPGAPTCERLVFSVAQAPGEPADGEVVTWLCSRGPIQNKTIQVLVHGATYDHHYWDFPHKPWQYSYVRAMTDAGYATLNMDRLGHGESSRVNGLQFDLAAGAFAIHQIIQALRAGIQTDEFGTVQAQRILLAGESIGANLAWLEAGTYHDVDGLHVAGSAHTFASGFAIVPQITIPVEQDPRFAHQGYPPGYFTTQPWTRGLAFYHLPEAEHAVVVKDEILKQTITLGENMSAVQTLPVSLQVTAPTLITVGDFDFLFCEPPSCTASGTLEHELDHWPAEACPELTIMPDSGHNLTLHRNAPDYFALVRTWADARVGASTLAPPPEPCTP